jgi:dienelactone hydrolase
VRSFGTALLLLLLFAAPASASVLVVGDSLVVGTAPYLRGQLSESVQSDGRVGRPSPEAVSVLRSKFSGQRVVVFDAGVNDDPARPATLSHDLASVRSLVSGRCLVVATMSRPPYHGVTVDGLNRAVRSFASSSSNVQLVDWRSAALSHPQLINSDGVHPTPAGYRLRAGLFAQAISACGSSGGSAPPSGGLPAPGTPPPTTAVPKPGSAAPPSPGHKRVRPPKPKPPKPKPKPKPPKLGSESPVVLDEPVSFAGADGVRLSGELLAPAGGTRHPAVVMIGGSGAATREPYREQAEFLAEHGVAALIYDKRGTGDSTGPSDYSYSKLAADARAAVTMLHSRPGLRADGIGVWGFGEGASIAPMVAAGNPSVAAVMAVSPSAIAPASQQEWAVRRALDLGGAGAGVDAVSRYYAVASDASSPDLRSDPGDSWRHVSQPVLAVWGSADRLVPIHDSAVALRSALAAMGAGADREFRTFVGASHSLGVASEGGRPGSAPGFKELSASWMRTHLRAQGSRSAEPLASTPLPPQSGPPVVAVQNVSLLERWPVQIAWLALPALMLLLVALAAWRRRTREGPRDDAPRWWWLAAVAALDLLAVGALAVAVAAIVADGGEGVAAVAGVPTVILVAWAFTLAGILATALLARRAGRLRSPATGVVLAGSAWLLLALYWLL